ncbi:hypothetical protein DSECCO2_403600 [anaerobic digester metagenome]
MITALFKTNGRELNHVALPGNKRKESVRITGRSPVRPLYPDVDKGYRPDAVTGNHHPGELNQVGFMNLSQKAGH